jgi:hypothetical protein
MAHIITSTSTHIFYMQRSSDKLKDTMSFTSMSIPTPTDPLHQRIHHVLAPYKFESMSDLRLKQLVGKKSHHHSSARQLHSANAPIENIAFLLSVRHLAPLDLTQVFIPVVDDSMIAVFLRVSETETNCIVHATSYGGIGTLITTLEQAVRGQVLRVGVGLGAWKN